MGDTVQLPNGHVGILRYIGQIDGKAGEFGGVELVGEYEESGRHNGMFNGRQYFSTTKPKSGVFSPLHKIVLVDFDGENEKENHAMPMTPVRQMPSQRSSLQAAGTTAFRQLGSTPRTAINGTSIMASPHSQHAKRSSVPALSPQISRSTQLQTPSRIRSTTQVPSPTHSRQNSMQSQIRTPSRRSLGASSIATPPAPHAPPNARHTLPSGTSSSMSSHKVQTSTNELEQEIQNLRAQLEQRDGQLEQQELQLNEQAEVLADLQQTVQEFTIEREEEQLQMRAQLEAAHASAGMRDPSKTDPDMDADIVALRQALEDKDRKVALLKSEHELKRQEFRKTIDTLEADTVAYENKIRSLEGDLQQAIELFEQVEFLSLKVTELESGLEASQRSEESAKERLSQLAGIENKLLEKEQELQEASEKVNEFHELMKSQPIADNNDLEKEIARLKQQLDQSQTGSDSTAEITDLKTKLEQAESACTALQLQIAQLQSQSESTNREGDDGLAMEHARKEFETLKLELVEQIDKLHDDNKTLAANVDQLTTQLEASRAENQSLQAQLCSNNDKITVLEAEHQKEKDRLSKELEESRKVPLESDLRAELEASEKERLELMNDIETLDKQLSELQEQSSQSEWKIEAERLRTELDNMEQMVERRILRETELESETEQLKKLSITSSSPPTSLAKRAGEELATTNDARPVVQQEPSFTERPAPKVNTDEGKELWCGMCDRYGHNSLECPYDEEF